MRRRRFQKTKVTKVTVIPASSNAEKLRIYCLFCYKSTDIEDTEDSHSQADKLNICHRFYKHIGGDGGEVHFTEGMYGAKCGVCDNCFYIIDNHCQLHYEIECLRLKLKWQMHKLCRVMKYAGKATLRVKDFEKDLIKEMAVTKGNNFNLERVLSFRQKLYSKCSKGLKKKHPRVVLSNALIANRNDENISVFKETNVLSRKSKMSKATQTISELMESTQDYSKHGNTEISADKNNDRTNDGKVASSDDQVVELDKLSQMETKKTDEINNEASHESSNRNHDRIEGFKFECGKGKIHSTNPIYKCILCDKVFMSNTALVEHERDKHWHLITGSKSKESLPNDNIGTIKGDLAERKYHGTNKSLNDYCVYATAAEQTFACALCGILYSGLHSLNAHLITAHNMLITPVTAENNDAMIVEESSANTDAKSQDKGFDKVPDKIAAEDEDVVAVRKTPRRAKRFQAECPKCGKIFKCVDKWRAKEKVKRHLRTKMHGGTGIWKVCDTCGRRFKTKHLLKMHRRSPCETIVSDGGDSTSGPGNLLVLREIFKCCHCVKTFSTQEKLASHEGARECFDENDDDNESETSDYGHYNDGVTRNSDWSNRKVAKLVKPVFTATCPKCWKVFERCNEKDLQAALNRHLYESKLHGGKHSWKHLCSFCGVRYQNKSRLETHMKRYHDEEFRNAGNDEHISGIDDLINSGPLEHLSWDMSNPIDESKTGNQMHDGFKCAFCDFRTNAYDLMDHENTYHSYYISDEKLKCSRCPQIFDMEMSQNYSSLRSHFLQAHLGIQANMHEEIDTRS